MEHRKHPNTDVPAGKGSTHLHRFFVPPENLRTDHAELTGPQAHQIADVLCLRPGHHIIILDNSAHEYEIILTTVTPNKAQGRILQKRPTPGEPAAPVTFEQAAGRLTDFDGALIAATAPNSMCPRSWLETARSEKYPKIALFIGPEGCFTDTKLQLALSRGAKPFTLGPRILRTETAAIVATAIILYELNQIIPLSPSQK